MLLHLLTAQVCEEVGCLPPLHNTIRIKQAGLEQRFILVFGRFSVRIAVEILIAFTEASNRFLQPLQADACLGTLFQLPLHFIYHSATGCCVVCGLEKRH
jgi:hypothetical protein